VSCAVYRRDDDDDIVDDVSTQCAGRERERVRERERERETETETETETQRWTNFGIFDFTQRLT